MQDNQRRGKRPENGENENNNKEMPAPLPPLPRNTKGAVNSQQSLHSDGSSLPKDDKDLEHSEGFDLKDADVRIESLVGGGSGSGVRNRTVTVSKIKISLIDSAAAFYCGQ